ncbi:fatc domain-containing protein [Cyclospora cayetanensis]|uniref:Fatc domain-containing protein n=1 Tax=Cyclospora cayetanensis TaxID=88456 RepID=A0A1D3CU32_9EIME|nr:fatc domain-containing protein [Cyclospora cayetanensis]
MEVLASKQKPKRVAVSASDGCEYLFLLKNERAGDIRKDMRAVDAAAETNRLLEQRQCHFKLRTFNITVLSEVSALIEWMPFARPLRNCLAAKYTLSMQDFRQLNETCCKRFQAAQTQRRFAECHKLLRDFILPNFPPILHKVYFDWFGEDPSRWYSARKAFTQTSAAWAAFGYVIGLGDRHCENILLDLKSGAALHVDFDCLFDKGQTLPFPEVVPFRLTQNIVAALGATATNGDFRTAAVTVLRLLRSNQNLLLSLFMAYTCIVNIQQKLRGAISALPPGAFEFSVHHQKDPQKEETRENADDGSSSSSSEASFLESEDEEAQAPAAAGSSAVAAAAHGSVGTLGVHAQVDALIRAATAEENLARMYVGWLPWY